MNNQSANDKGAQASSADPRIWETLAELYEHAAIGIYRMTRAGEPVFANQAFVRMMGYCTEAEWLDAAPAHTDHWYVDPKRHQAFLDEIGHTGRVANFESEIFVHKTREKIWVSETARAVYDETGRTVFFEGTIEDITSRKRLETDLQIARRSAERLSHEDAESGLLNRRALEHELSRMLGARTHPFIAAITVSRYAHIRNAIGYLEAAKVICEIATRVEALASEAIVARIEPDTIAVLVDLESEDRAVAQLQEMIAAGARPVTLKDGTIDVQLTGGLSFGGDAVGINQIDQARIAIDQAKADDLEFAVFDAKAYGDPADTLSLMTEMVSAMISGDLYMVYQPKYQFSTGTISDMEALVRWRHAERGFISPASFIPVAEETGQIRPLTEWSMRQVIKEQEKLFRNGVNVAIAINISGRLLSDTRFVERALSIVERTEARLCFEITETAVIREPKRALEAINAFRRAGVAISIDDYGTGLSSLSYLKQIPAHELKIDRAFIMDLLGKSSDMVLVRSTIELAHSLGMTVVAEGVEDFETLRVLCEIGADKAQGFCIAKPRPMIDWLDNLEAFAQSPGIETLARA